MAVTGAAIGLGAAYFVTSDGDETTSVGPEPTAEPTHVSRAPDPPLPPHEARERAGGETAPATVGPSASATTTATASASASATASASASGAAPAAGDLPAVTDEHGGDGSDLLSNKGYLIVRSPVSAEVVVQGVSRGMTNEKLISSCYTRNVRLRDPDSKAWVTKGQAVKVTCMGTTTVTIVPDP
jgi:hypothetical protein